MDESWDQRYRAGDTPWDSGAPSLELARVLDARAPFAGPALEVGCGTGATAIWLGSRGYTVTACDVSSVAITAARARPGADQVRFLVADLLRDPDLGGPFGFVFDRGTYHVLRRVGAEPYLRLLARITEPGAHYLVLTGNANDPSEEGGPPRVAAHELCAELQPWWDLVELREFVFHGICIEGRNPRALGWSGLFRRRDRAVGTRATLFEHAGGAPAILALATAHHRRCLADPELNHAFSHPTLNPEHVRRLAAYWGEVLGGPADFTAQYGTQTSAMRMHACGEDVSAWGPRFVACFVAAMDDAGLPDDPAFRAAMRAYVEWATAEFLGVMLGVAADVPDGLAVPRWTWDGLATAR